MGETKGESRNDEVPIFVTTGSKRSSSDQQLSGRSRQEVEQTVNRALPLVVLTV